MSEHHQILLSLNEGGGAWEEGVGQADDGRDLANDSLLVKIAVSGVNIDSKVHA